jgi:hypothetical protein
MDPHEILDARLYDLHQEEIEREAAAQARVDRLKNVSIRGLVEMARVLALTGERDDEPDQTEGWLRALSGDHCDEAEMLFDAAIKFVERKHPNPNPNVEAKPKRMNPMAQPGCSTAEAKRKQMVEAAEARMKRQRH